MFKLFTQLADLVSYDWLNLTPGTRWADAVHFFVEDVSKIFTLLVIMIYSIAFLRASLNAEKVRTFLSNKHPSIGYFLGSSFGAITPFCSCSSIPVFLGFTSAGIPVGITMSFLLTSPLINEVAALLLVSLLGWKLTVFYIVIGMTVGILGGFFLDLIHAERWLQPFAAKALMNARQSINDSTVRPPTSTCESHLSTLTLADRHIFAKSETRDIFTRVWKWVFIGVGLGAALHGFVPDNWIETHLGDGQWWTVPAAVILGIPLYANATGIIPVIESLISNGLPIGTTLAFCMSTVAASFPEFILLKQVMQWKLLAILFAMLLFSFTVIGWAFNALSFLL